MSISYAYKICIYVGKSWVRTDLICLCIYIWSEGISQMEVPGYNTEPQEYWNVSKWQTLTFCHQRGQTNLKQIWESTLENKVCFSIINTGLLTSSPFPNMLTSMHTHTHTCTLKHTHAYTHKQTCRQTKHLHGLQKSLEQYMGGLVIGPKWFGS